MWDEKKFYIDEIMDIPHWLVKPADGKYRIKTGGGKYKEYLYMYAVVQNGKFNGPCQLFYDNGNIKQTGFLLNGVKSGVWSSFNESGQLINQSFINEKNAAEENYEIKYSYDVYDSLSSIYTIKGEYSKQKKVDTFFVNPVNKEHLKLLYLFASQMPGWEMNSSDLHVLETHGYGGNSMYISFMSSKTASAKGNCGVSIDFIPKKYQQVFKSEKRTGQFFESNSYLIYVNYCSDSFPYWADEENKKKYQKELPVFLEEVKSFVTENYNNL